VTLSSASRGFWDAPISEFLAEIVDLEGQSAARPILGDWFPLRGQGKLLEPDL
jgi:hypothetical protein